MPMPMPGRYVCGVGERSCYEAESGSLVFVVNCLVDDQTNIKSYNTLVNKDGAVNTRTMEKLKQIFGWDGCDPFELVDKDYTGVQFEITVEDELYDGKTRPKVKYIDPIGSSNGGGVKPSGDRAAILAKYGAKFRAVAGGMAPRTPARAPAPAAPKVPAAPQPPPPATPPEPTAAPSTMQDAWAALCEAAKDSPKEAMEKIWHGVLNQVARGRRQTELTAHEWGQVKAMCLQNADAIPY